MVHYLVFENVGYFTIGVPRKAQEVAKLTSSFGKVVIFVTTSGSFLSFYIVKALEWVKVF